MGAYLSGDLHRILPWRDYFGHSRQLRSEEVGDRQGGNPMKRRTPQFGRPEASVQA